MSVLCIGLFYAARNLKSCVALCSMIFGPNDSPIAGKEGSQLTGSKIGERLNAEAETSVSLRVLPVDGGGESFEVQARGELQLGLLIGGAGHPSTPPPHPLPSMHTPTLGPFDAMVEKPARRATLFFVFCVASE